MTKVKRGIATMFDVDESTVKVKATAGSVQLEVTVAAIDEEHADALRAAIDAATTGQGFTSLQTAIDSDIELMTSAVVFSMMPPSLPPITGGDPASLTESDDSLEGGLMAVIIVAGLLTLGASTAALYKIRIMRRKQITRADCYAENYATSATTGVEQWESGVKPEASAKGADHLPISLKAKSECPTSTATSSPTQEATDLYDTSNCPAHWV